ncbi:uncharacterized mitochondrial protein AtMg00810-like [Lactuca sativa]|uniref:uncharacterized mitochondrial protein AtMg00810-like n=1 Tax=Lactuca sativa TaxID=4236 RepID=UPI0022AE97B1|nr:uncharacterized mitochondrial protein AtMg00810-like [Lactuca sativa]
MYASVARLEAICVLAYASYMGFTIYQMDVKTAFLYGVVKEDIYVDQPPGFVNSKVPNHIYVDDIFFGSTSSELCREFEEVRKKRFEMSSRGEMTMFLGLQIRQDSSGILLHQGKYMEDMLVKFGLKDFKHAFTPMDERPLLGPNPEGDSVDQTEYRSMIGSLMYFPANRADIMFVVCQCARYQANPKLSHMIVVKMIFRYLKGSPKLGLWYPKISEFDLYAFGDSNYGGCDFDRKSTSGGCQFLGERLVSWQCKKQQTMSTSTAGAEYVAASTCCSQVLIWELISRKSDNGQLKQVYSIESELSRLCV